MFLQMNMNRFVFLVLIIVKTGFQLLKMHGLMQQHMMIGILIHRQIP